MPPGLQTLRDQIADVVTGLTGVSKDLQETSRGIHPAILSRGGLGPALKTLARRSTVPVELRVDVDRRLPDRAEVGAYYLVAEGSRMRPNMPRHPKSGCRLKPTPHLCMSRFATTVLAEPTHGRAPDSSG